MREYMKIKSADGKAIKTITKSEYPLYAQGGWKEYKDPNKPGQSPYNGTSYTGTANK